MIVTMMIDPLSIMITMMILSQVFSVEIMINKNSDSVMMILMVMMMMMMMMVMLLMIGMMIVMMMMIKLP